MIASLNLNQPITKKHLFVLFAVAFLVRALTFYGYIRHNERYKQADSVDYHNGALCIKYGHGMHRPDTGAPIFWRTPGYPVYLMLFYNMFDTDDFTFEGAATAQQASIWFQIFLSAFVPLILFLLALYLTNSLIAYITAWIAVFHLGLVLASTYLLTEATSIIPFYLFLLYFYRSFSVIFEQPQKHQWIKNLIIAALMLALYAWFRPMGQFVAIIGALTIFLFAQDSWKLKGKKISLFLFIFFTCISPWYIRNYQLTGRLFFCPMFGAYLNSFCAPRIKAEVEQIELIDAWKELGMQTELKYRQQAPRYKRIGITLPKEFVCSDIAWPIFLSHPWLAFYDWMREVFKTTFDLYSSQLDAFVKGCFFYDPLIEYLSEKLQDCLYKTPMPWFMRFNVYLELIYALLLWTGLFGGLWLFMLMPLIHKFKVSNIIKQYFGLWLKISPMIAGILFMTGGFGYARLRLPIEPLMIILSLTFWQYVFQKKNH
jgi:hypothetical protein